MRTTRATGDQYAAEILRTIKKVREENKACTAREVSRLMRETHTLVTRQLEVLRAAGYVRWTTMPGSLVVTPDGGKYIVRVENGESPLADAKRAARHAAVENEQSPPPDGSEGSGSPDGTGDGQSPGSSPSNGND